uniref:Uncharacterized protein n=1 Tax=Aegilops tauschii TaxID=37682 RepID=M8CVC9_AEGTA
MANRDGSMGTKQERCSPSAVDWSNLPDDLLGMVTVRVASPLGRVRFTAFCRSWRTAALQHPTAALLLLVLSPVDRGTVTEKRVPIPSKLRNMQFIGSYDGGWITAIERSSSDYDGGWMGTVDGSAMFLIVNLFSGVEVPLSEKQRHFRLTDDYEQDFIWKIVFSKVPTSGDCILVAMTAGRKVALCKIGCPDGGWTIQGCDIQGCDIQGCDMKPVWDIVFYRGELYGLGHSKTLYTFDIGVNEDGAPTVTAAYSMDVQRGSDPIFMSRWLQNCKPFFKVFQVTNVDDDARKYEWEEVGSLGNCALFLGQLCSSKVVQMPADGRGAVERNHIYYSNHHSGASQEDQESEEEYNTKSEYGDLLFHRKTKVLMKRHHMKRKVMGRRVSRAKCLFPRQNHDLSVDLMHVFWGWTKTSRTMPVAAGRSQCRGGSTGRSSGQSLSGTTHNTRWSQKSPVSRNGRVLIWYNSGTYQALQVQSFLRAGRGMAIIPELPRYNDGSYCAYSRILSDEKGKGLSYLYLLVQLNWESMESTLPKGVDFGDRRTVLSRTDDSSGVYLIHVTELRLHIWLHNSDNWLPVGIICLREKFTNLRMLDHTFDDDCTADVHIRGVGDNAAFVFLTTGRCVLFVDIKCGTLRKVHDMTNDDISINDIYPFMTIWPPTFPELKNDPARLHLFALCIALIF